MSGALEIRAIDEALLLLPERAVFWPRRRMLIVADTHFGKSGFFGMHGLAVPAGTDRNDRDLLARLVALHQAAHLVVLGDFLHAPLAPGGGEAQALTAWSAALRPTQLHVVAGNHDRGTVLQWRPPFDWYERDWTQPPFRFIHDATGLSGRAEKSFALSGHLHPIVRLPSLRSRGLRVPAFWHRPDRLVLPSFGSFTGGCVVRKTGEDRVYAVTGKRVIGIR